MIAGTSWRSALRTNDCTSRLYGRRHGAGDGNGIATPPLPARAVALGEELLFRATPDLEVSAHGPLHTGVSIRGTQPLVDSTTLTVHGQASCAAGRAPARLAEASSTRVQPRQVVGAPRALLRRGSEDHTGERYSRPGSAWRHFVRRPTPLALSGGALSPSGGWAAAFSFRLSVRRRPGPFPSNSEGEAYSRQGGECTHDHRQERQRIVA